MTDTPREQQILHETYSRACEGCEGPPDQVGACYTVAPENPVAWCHPCLHEQSNHALTALRSELETFKKRPARTGCDDCLEARRSAEASLEAVRSELEQVRQERDQRIVTRCPSCGHQSLFIGSGGYLTCSWLECKQPGFDAALEQKTKSAEASLAEVRQQLANWRSWAQFVYLGGGPPVMGDVLMREEVARRTDTDLDELKNKLTRSQYEVQALGQILHDVEGQLAAERDEFYTLLRSQILISETKNTLLRKRLAQQDETLKGLREAIKPHHACSSCDLGDEERARREGWNAAMHSVSALLSPPPQEPPAHVCGLQGYDPMQDAPCPGCDVRRASEATSSSEPRHPAARWLLELRASRMHCAPNSKPIAHNVILRKING